MEELQIFSKSTLVDYPKSKEAKTYLLPDELATLVRYLTSIDHGYFPKDNELKLQFSRLMQRPDSTVALFRSSYSSLCWQSEVLDKAGFNFGRQVLEVGSGNNDLVTSPALSNYLEGLHKDKYLLSNYSGGRGDYFSLQFLAKILSARLKHSSSRESSVTIENLCHTVGAQGAISGLADYFAKHFPGKSVLFPDSTYCGMYAPFAKSGVTTRFIKSQDCSRLPEISKVIEELRNPEVIAYFLIPYHNPSGEVFSKEDLELICSEVQKLGKFLIVSEVYDGMGWNSSHDITAQLDSIILNSGLANFARLYSLSKSRGLAGLRAGYMFSTAEICAHVLQVNALHSFNPPMSNAKLIVLHELLSLYQRTKNILPEVLEYLGLSFEQFGEIFNLHKTEREFLNSQCRRNFLSLVHGLLDGQEINENATLSHTIVSNSKYDILIPRGGMNCCVRIKYLNDFDQIDIFRKVYLWSGLIMHTSQYINKDTEGVWVRVTLTHSEDIVSQMVDTLKRLEINFNKLQLLPVGSLSCRIV